MRSKSASETRDALGELEVVVEAVLDRRADRDLHAGIELQHRGGEHVRGVVADRSSASWPLRSVTISSCAPSGSGAGEVAELAVDLDGQRRAREARRRSRRRRRRRWRRRGARAGCRRAGRIRIGGTVHAALCRRAEAARLRSPERETPFPTRGLSPPRSGAFLQSRSPVGRIGGAPARRMRGVTTRPREGRPPCRRGTSPRALDVGAHAPQGRRSPDGSAFVVLACDRRRRRRRRRSVRRRGRPGKRAGPLVPSTTPALDPASETVLSCADATVASRSAAVPRASRRRRPGIRGRRGDNVTSPFAPAARPSPRTATRRSSVRHHRRRPRGAGPGRPVLDAIDAVAADHPDLTIEQFGDAQRRQGAQRDLRRGPREGRDCCRCRSRC